MTNSIQFTSMPGSTGYQVHDRAAAPHPSPGYVIRVGRGSRSWAVVPTFDRPVTTNSSHPRKIFDTRRAAAHALIRYADTLDPAWIHAMPYN